MSPLPRADMDPVDRIWFEIHDQYGCRATDLARKAVSGALRMVEDAIEAADFEVAEGQRVILTLDALRFVADECRREGELRMAAAILTFLTKSAEHVVTSVEAEDEYS